MQTTQPPNPTEVKAADAKPADAAPAADAPADKPAADAKPKEENFLFDEKKDEAKPEDKKEGDDKPKDGEQPPVTLEALTIPDDVVVADSMKEPVNALISTHKLGKEAAQAVVDLGVKMRQDDLNSWQATKKEWLGQIMADPELGGANADKTKAVCNNVIRKFGGSPENMAELQQDLILLGLGNKRSFVRLLTNMAKATGQDTTNAADPAGATQPQGGNDIAAMAKRIYPNMNP